MKTLVYFFGFTWTCATDVARMEVYMKTTGHDVVAVNWTSEGNIPGNRPQISVNFKRSKDIEPVLDHIRSQKGSYRRIWCFLDYFWLESGYYRNNYGMDWLVGKDRCESKCFRLLEAGVNAVFLPKDGGRNNGSGRNMESMLKEYEDATSGRGPLSIRFVSTRDHPLWVASALPELQRVYEVQHRGSNEYQTRSYLSDKDPFLKVTMSKRRFKSK